MILFHTGETSAGFHTNSFQDVEYWGCKKDYDRRYECFSKLNITECF